MVNKQFLLTLLVSSTLVACSAFEDGYSNMSTASKNDSKKSGGGNGSGSGKGKLSANVEDIQRIVMESQKTGRLDKGGRYMCNILPTADLKVNGKKISLTHNKKGFLDLMSSSQEFPRILSGNEYKSHFGLIDGGSTITAFSKGEQTKKADMPVTGSATYKGNYAGYNFNNKKSGTGEFTGTADFANKKFNVFLGADNTGFSGGSTDTNFIGFNQFRIPHINNNNGKTLFGHFFGENAEEAGGAYHDANYTAAFGGKKQ